MALEIQTIDQSELLDRPTSGPAVPGLVLVLSGSRPLAVPVPLVDGGIELGREHPAFAQWHDPRMSRRHALVRLEGTRVSVTDLGSRNGTSAEGRQLPPRVRARHRA